MLILLTPGSRDVIVKLLAFTLAMIVVPIGSYFASVNTIYKGMLCTHINGAIQSSWFNAMYAPAVKIDPSAGNSTYAGATAAIMANVVLIAYVFVAMREDQSDQRNSEAKKDR